MSEQTESSIRADRLIALGAVGAALLTLTNIKISYKHALSDREYDYLASIASQLEDLGKIILDTFSQEK